MKRHKSMLILLAVFVVLVGAYFIMVNVNEKEDEEDIAETVMVTDLTDIISMEYSDKEKTILLTKEDSAWFYSDDKEMDLDEKAVEDMAYALGHIKAVRKLEGADEPASYGLDEPAYTIKLKTADEKEVVLYIGDASEENYYATVDKKEVIYTIDSTAVTSLEFDVTNLEVEEEIAE